MVTTFNEQLWIDFDLEIAVFLENLALWIRFNASKDKIEHRNYYEGRYWSYDSYKELSKRFTGWSDQTIRRIIKRAVAAELIIIGNFNKKKYDNTNWYTLTDKALSYFPQLHGLFLYTPVEIDNTPVEIDKPIPEDLNHRSNINITISDNSQKTTKESELIAEVIEAYHKEMPELPKIRVLDMKLKNQIRKMMKDWPRYEKDGNQFTIPSFIAYLNYIKNTYSWFIKPYQTKQGNRRVNNLRTLTTETTITKIINGEFSVN